jgi:hypothetical protein
MSRPKPWETVTKRGNVLAYTFLAWLLTAFASVPARAQDFYLGASGVWLDPGNGLAEFGDSGFCLVAGFETGGLIGAEVGYLDWSGPVADGYPTIREELNLSALSMAVTGRLALESSLTPYAKVGWLFWEVDGEITDESTPIPTELEYSRSGLDLFLAVGVGADLGSVMTAFGELAMYEVDDRVIHSVGLGLRVRL